MKEFQKFVNEFKGFFDKDHTNSKKRDSLNEGLHVIESFLNLIKQNKEKLRSEEVLSMNFLYEEACRLKKEMVRNTE
jgi:hypothetical protein